MSFIKSAFTLLILVTGIYCNARILKNDFLNQTEEINSQNELTNSDPIAEVYSDYIGIKNSLTRDNPDSASMFAKRLFNAIDKFQAEKLSVSQRAEWVKYSTKLSYDAEHIKGTAELEHQREHFMSLSKNMYELVKAFNTNTEFVYYQFCPMANHGKGAYWISEESIIVNPYFGKKMLHCGSTKETINPKK